MENFLSGRENLGDKTKQSKAKSRERSGLSQEWEEISQGSEEAVLNEEKGDGGSRVSYITEDGRVTKIVVTCACGQVTEIDCDYEA